MKLSGLQESYKDGVTIDIIVENLQNEIQLQQNKINKSNRHINRLLIIKNEISEEKRELRGQIRFYKEDVGDNIKADKLKIKYDEVCEAKEKILNQLFFENRKIYSKTEVIQKLEKHLMAILSVDDNT